MCPENNLMSDSNHLSTTRTHRGGPATKTPENTGLTAFCGERREREMDAAVAPRPNKSRDEQWMSNFLAVQAFYQKYEHLSIPDKTLSQWLTYQRLHAKTLNDRQLTLLDSIKYKDMQLCGGRKKDKEKWMRRYEELEKYVSETGSMRGLPPSLRSWINRQKCKFKDHLLQPNQHRLLEEIGVDLPGYKPRAGSEDKKTNYDEIWMDNYLKLKKYSEQYGDCNVPYRFTEDPSLGEWVSNQRKRLKLNGKDHDDYRVENLNEIGFEWTRKPEKSKLRNRSWYRTKSEEKVKEK
jgi:hypothetical protein